MVDKVKLNVNTTRSKLSYSDEKLLFIFATLNLTLNCWAGALGAVVINNFLIKLAEIKHSDWFK